MEFKQTSCFSDLRLCTKGLTIAFRLKALKLTENSIILSSGGEDRSSYGVAVIVKFNRLYYIVTSETKAWYASTKMMSVSKWAKVEISWSEEDGLFVYNNDEIVASAVTFTQITRRSRSSSTLLIGRSTTTMVTAETFSEFEMTDVKIFDTVREFALTAGLVEGMYIKPVSIGNDIIYFCVFP